MRTASTIHFAIALLATFAMAGVARATSPNLLISEFRTRGPAGANDEFIEIWNNSGSAIDISGYTLRGSNNAGATSIRATVSSGTVLGAGCYFLFTNTAANGYSGAVLSNQSYATGITDDGGIAIVMPLGGIVDQVGMSIGSAYKEGTVLATTLTNNNQSYERKPGGGSGNSMDTDNNLNDFVFHAASSDPQNRGSLCLGATPTRKDTWGSVKTFYR